MFNKKKKKKNLNQKKSIKKLFEKKNAKLSFIRISSRPYEITYFYKNYNKNRNTNYKHKLQNTI